MEGRVWKTEYSLVPRPWLHKSKSLGPLQNLKASNEIAKRRLLEYCSSERIYILPCESNSFTILWLSLCLVLSGPFATAGSLSCIYVLYQQSSSDHILFESRIHKVAVELPNIIEGLVGVQLCTLFLLQICLTDGSANTTSASGIVPTVRWYYK